MAASLHLSSIDSLIHYVERENGVYYAMNGEEALVKEPANFLLKFFLQTSK